MAARFRAQGAPEPSDLETVLDQPDCILTKTFEISGSPPRDRSEKYYPDATRTIGFPNASRTGHLLNVLADDAIIGARAAAWVCWTIARRL